MVGQLLFVNTEMGIDELIVICREVVDSNYRHNGQVRVVAKCSVQRINEIIHGIQRFVPDVAHNGPKDSIDVLEHTMINMVRQR